MNEVFLFGEDSAHEQVVGSILRCLANKLQVQIQLKVRSATGGHGRVFSALSSFVRDIGDAPVSLPCLVVVAIDANCLGFNQRKQQIDEHCQKLSRRSLPVAHAIPDPHVERWLLVDSAAFKAVLGVGCDAPDQKCQRGRYKRLLREAIQKAGINPSLGGIEYAADIVAEMDFTHVPHTDESLAKFIASVTQQFREWQGRGEP